MLQLSGAILNRPVLSLRTGSAIATATAPIINPNNLKIEGFYCIDRFNNEELILLYQDVRDVIEQGIVVNDHENLTDPEDLVRLKDLLEMKFQLIGKPVETVGKQKIGKVNDFATEITTMYVQKLYVSQSVLKSFTGGTLSVDRTQVTEITNRRIIIQDLIKGTPAHAAAIA